MASKFDGDVAKIRKAVWEEVERVLEPGWQTRQSGTPTFEDLRWCWRLIPDLTK